MLASSSFVNPYVLTVVIVALLGATIYLAARHQFGPALFMGGLLALTCHVTLGVLAMQDKIWYQSGEQPVMSFGNLPREAFDWPMYVGLGLLALWALVLLVAKMRQLRTYRQLGLTHNGRQDVGLDILNSRQGRDLEVTQVTT
jgi:hypothetical protein